MDFFGETLHTVGDETTREGTSETTPVRPKEGTKDCTISVTGTRKQHRQGRFTFGEETLQNRLRRSSSGSVTFCHCRRGGRGGGGE